MKLCFIRASKTAGKGTFILEFSVLPVSLRIAPCLDSALLESNLPGLCLFQRVKPLLLWDLWHRYLVCPGDTFH